MFLNYLKINCWPLIPIVFFSTWPPLAMASLVVSFCASCLRSNNFRITKLYLISLLCFSGILMMSFMTSLYNSEELLAAKNFKFLFYLIALSLGFSLARLNYATVYTVSFYFFCTFLIFQYLLYGWSAEARANGVFYLPDQNNSMIIISFFFPALLNLSSGRMKLVVSILTMSCMFLIGSRAGTALVGFVFIYFLLRELGVVSRFYLFSLLLFILLYVNADLSFILKLFELNSYSDKVRFTLWKIGLENFYQKDSWLFGFNSDFFNIYNSYLRNEMKHVHNMYLQVLFTTGGGGALLISAFFISWLISCFKRGNKTLLLQVLIVMALGMVETVYSDSRVFVVICFFLGFSYCNFSYVNRPGVK